MVVLRRPTSRMSKKLHATAATTSRRGTPARRPHPATRGLLAVCGPRRYAASRFRDRLAVRVRQFSRTRRLARCREAPFVHPFTPPLTFLGRHFPIAPPTTTTTTRHSTPFTPLPTHYLPFTSPQSPARCLPRLHYRRRGRYAEAAPQRTTWAPLHVRSGGGWQGAIKDGLQPP